MASPDDLIIEIRANADKLLSELGAAEKKLEQFEQKSKGAGGGLASAMQDAAKAVDDLTQSTNRLDGAYRDANGRLRDATGKFLSMKDAAAIAAKNGIDLSQALARVGDQADLASNDIDQATDATNRLGDGARRARQAINDSMQAIAASMALATGAAVLLTNQAADSAMDLQRFAAISNMSAQEFQFYAAGASAMGVSVEQLGQMLKDTQDKIGDFVKSEGGELEEFFTDIAPKVGVTIEQFRKLSGKDALQLYVDSLQKAGVGHDQMVNYMESIADDVSILLPLLKDGGKGFEAFGNAAKKAGGLMSDEFIDKASEMKTSMWLLEQSLKGARNQMAEELLPVLRDLAGEFADTSQGQSAAAKTGMVFANVLRGMVAIATGAVAAFDLFGQSLGVLAGIGSDFARSWDFGANPITNLAMQAVALKAMSGKIKESFADVGKSAEQYAEKINAALAAGTGVAKDELKTLAGLLDEANKIQGGGNTGALGKKADEEAKKAADKARKDADARAKELAAAKQQAQDMLETIRQSAMDEEQVRARQYQLAKAQIDDRYKNELISAEEHQEAVKNLEIAYNNETRNRAQALTSSLLASTQDRFAQIEAEYQKRNAEIEKLAKLTGMPQGDKDQMLSDSTQIMRNQMAEELVIRSNANAEDLQQRLQQNEALAELVQQAGMTEIEIMQAQHAAKMEVLANMSAQELAMHGITKDQIYQLQADHDARMLDLQMNTGTLMQDMTNSLQQGTLAGNLKFLATSFSAFSGHSKKMFEAQKALSIASALLTIPKTVMDSYAEGAKIGGPAIGAVYAATALSTQLAQLQKIRSATFGGGSSGGGGGGGGSSSSVSGGSGESAAPITQRFVSVGLYGSDNTMYSKEAVRELITRIGEEVADGAVLRVT
jgi:hypothetical protein